MRGPMYDTDVRGGRNIRHTILNKIILLLRMTHTPKTYPTNSQPAGSSVQPVWGQVGPDSIDYLALSLLSFSEFVGWCPIIMHPDITTPCNIHTHTHTHTTHMSSGARRKESSVGRETLLLCYVLCCVVLCHLF
jgi:hypothetical protein